MSLELKLKEAIINGDKDAATSLAREALELGLDPIKIANEVLVPAILEIGERWVRGEAFIVDIILAADAMKAALDVLKPEIVKRGGEVRRLGRVVIGTVEGDIHDIGKNIVATMLEASGFEVIDLGVDVPPAGFVDAVRRYNPDVVGMSALLTSTMVKQKETIEALKAAGLRNKVKVIIGGAPTSEEWAKEIGADGWAPDAISAIDLVKKLLGIK
ncbi:MAG: corrinoid protein [Thermosphaera sp.]